MHVYVCVCLCVCLIQDLNNEHTMSLWIAKLKATTAHIQSWPRNNLARLPLVLFQAWLPDLILPAGHTHADLSEELSLWLNMLRGYTPNLPDSYWRGLEETYWDPSADLSRPVLRETVTRCRLVVTHAHQTPKHTYAHEQNAPTHEQIHALTPAYSFFFVFYWTVVGATVWSVLSLHA